MRDEKAWGQESSTTINNNVTNELYNEAKKQNANIKPVYWTTGHKGTFAQLLNDDAPLTNENPASIFVCGDNVEARKQTIELVSKLKGFKGLDCGELKYSKIIELLGPLFIVTMDKNNNNFKQNGYWTYQCPSAGGDSENKEKEKE